MTPNELAIARSVVYASLFDYPLTLEQLHESLIESHQRAADILDTYDGSDDLQMVVDYRNGFFFPAGRDDLIAERRRREARSRAFFARHRLLIRFLCAVPFTRLVALSGSAAHLNLEQDGDLDLFIVTRGARVWTVTLAVLCLARLLGQRRIVCANFVLADSHLALDQEDLFTANQVIHLKPLIGADVLDAFVAANPFVRRFYPNGLRKPPTAPVAVPSRGMLAVMKSILECVLALPSPAIEAASRRLYGWHLRRRAASWQSPGQVCLRQDYLKLHTRSHRHTIVDRFEAAMEKASAISTCRSRRCTSGDRPTAARGETLRPAAPSCRA